MIKDDIHDYVRYLNIRKGLVEDLMTLINQYKLPLQLNATNTSYINPANAHFVAELVSRLVASAALFSAQSYLDDRFHDRFNAGRQYKGKDKGKEKEHEQKHLLEETLAKLSEAEVPHGLVDVRTIDESPSHQAEVIIYDLVQTDKPGFVVEDERLTVMTTRAQVQAPSSSYVWECISLDQRKEMLEALHTSSALLKDAVFPPPMLIYS
ncbi:hypothetical protein THAR02_00606 [Trichoderma harzianum]|uniref:DNA2/NAM7 helicase-like C-terminal domain-containing protein n=1 Tax=Trichoderma harzianum TaxID=5544 RepID=A0A0G0A4Y0_TRIHA|nr:hypothetical protein THAR02_00606 [Trichoderma harzianum]